MMISPRFRMDGRTARRDSRRTNRSRFRERPAGRRIRSFSPLLLNCIDSAHRQGLQKFLVQRRTRRL